MTALAVLLCGLGFVARATASITMYDYNHVRYTHHESVSSLLRAAFTGDGVSLGNVVVGVATPECAKALENPSFRGSQRHAGGEVLSSMSIILPVDGRGGTFPVTQPAGVCAEYFFYRAHDRVEGPTGRLTTLTQGNINDWIMEMTFVQVKVHNAFPFAVDMHWYEENTDPRIDGSIGPDDGLNIGTFIGHIFVFKRQGTDEVVDYFVVDQLAYTASPANRLEACSVGLSEMSHLDGSYGVDVSGTAGMGTFTHGKLIECDDVYTRMEEFCHRVWYDKRLGLNYVQPALVPAVTQGGFELRRMPEDTFAWLRDWYARERHRIAVDEENIGPCMNIRAAQSEVTHLPEKGMYSKQRLSEELLEVMEGWYGDKLTLTSIYGVRKYTNESVLRMHVDTANTHVVSAIINVDQEVNTPAKQEGGLGGDGDDEDWPLVILDHDGVEHRLVMRPGDLLLYESAKLLHGRPTPLRATSYSNIFIHYMPHDWDIRGL